MARLYPIIGLLVLATTAVFAQSDPFQSNPGPPQPVRPAPPRVTRPAPEPDAPPPLAPPSRWDGIWSGSFECAAYQTHVAFSFIIVLEVKNNRVVSRLNEGSTLPGTPGYDTWIGDIAADGSVSIQRSGLSGGIAGAAPRGAPFAQRIDGRFTGDGFVGRDVTDLPRECGVKLIRTR